MKTSLPLALALAMTGCGASSGRVGGSPVESDKGTCAVVSAAITAGDYARWQGLPACMPSALAAAWGTTADGSASAPLGEDHTPAAFAWLSSPSALPAVRMWWRDDGVALVDIDGPRLAQPDAELLAALGEPAARLDFAFDVLTVPGGERVHPERGLTVYVNSENGMILRVALYGPTDLTGWRRLRLDLTTRELPAAD